MQLIKTRNKVITDITGSVTMTKPQNRITLTEQSQIVAIFQNLAPGNFIIRNTFNSKTTSIMTERLLLQPINPLIK